MAGTKTQLKRRLDRINRAGAACIQIILGRDGRASEVFNLGACVRVRLVADGFLLYLLSRWTVEPASDHTVEFGDWRVDGEGLRFQEKKNPTREVWFFPIEANSEAASEYTFWEKHRKANKDQISKAEEEILRVKRQEIDDLLRTREELSTAGT